MRFFMEGRLWLTCYFKWVLKPLTNSWKQQVIFLTYRARATLFKSVEHPLLRAFGRQYRSRPRHWETGWSENGPSEPGLLSSHAASALRIRLFWGWILRGRDNACTHHFSWKKRARNLLFVIVTWQITGHDRKKKRCTNNVIMFLL